MLSVLRIETVHPALVHLTIGGIAVSTLAYVAAAWTRSSRLSFAGDFALVTTAALTLVTAAFGIVAYEVVRWPGGLAPWSSLHLALGIATTVLIAALACVRLARRGRPTGAPAAIAAILVFAATALTGWIGGDVLVFHGGIAVRAAAEGALSPPLSFRPAPARDLLGTMDTVRAVWSQAVTTQAVMVVHQPSDADFATLVDDARQLDALASWIAEHGASSLPNADEPLRSHSPGHAGAAEMQGSRDETCGDHLADMARDFGNDARSLAAKAAARDVEGAWRALGRVGADCAGCHEELRWR